MVGPWGVGCIRYKYIYITLHGSLLFFWIKVILGDEVEVSIVQIEKIENDPQEFLYRFPDITAVEYHKMQQEFTFWKTVQIAEKVAEVSGLLLVPRSCIHWERKLKFDCERRIIIKKRVFYLISESDMTESEKNKYYEFNKLFPDFLSYKKLRNKEAKPS